MKRALLALAVVAICSATGCQSVRKNTDVDTTSAYHICHPGLAEMHRNRGAAAGPAGPATPTYGYPYYTTRGPRDFLVDNPPSIGN